MTPPAFDRVMVHHEIAHHLKLVDLNDSEFKAFILGVLVIAAKAPMRGAFTVNDAPAAAKHVARQANVQPRVAASTIEKLRDVGILETHDDGVEWVHDFQEYNPAPKVDDTSAERARRYRATQKAKRDAARGVTPDTTPAAPGVHQPDDVCPSGFPIGPLTAATHPRLTSVLEIFRAIPAGKVLIEEMAVNAACCAKPGADVVAGAHLAASWALAGTMREKHASRLLSIAMDKIDQREAQKDGIRAAAEKTGVAGPSHLRPVPAARGASVAAEMRAELEAAKTRSAS